MGGDQRVAQQHRDRHRADAAGHRGDGADMTDEIDDAGRLGARSQPERVVVSERCEQVVQVPRRSTRTRAEREILPRGLVLLRAEKRMASAVQGTRARRAHTCYLK